MHNIHLSHFSTKKIFFMNMKALTPILVMSMILQASGYWMQEAVEAGFECKKIIRTQVFCREINPNLCKPWWTNAEKAQNAAQCRKLLKRGRCQHFSCKVTFLL